MSFASRWSGVTMNVLCVVILRVVFHAPSIAMNSGDRDRRGRTVRGSWAGNRTRRSSLRAPRGRLVAARAASGQTRVAAEAGIRSAVSADGTRLAVAAAPMRRRDALGLAGVAFP